MIGAVVLFQVPLLTAQPPPEPPTQPARQAVSEAATPEVAAPEPTPAPRARRPVSARPLDLSTVASRVRLNLKALDGWEPKKGTAAPSVEYPPVPEQARRPAEPRREAVARIVNLEPPQTDWESVNSFQGPRPSFYGPPPCWHQGGQGECAHARGPGRGRSPAARPHGDSTRQRRARR